MGFYAMNTFYYSLLITLFGIVCAGFLDFPTGTIRRLSALDVIGGYPAFIKEVYIPNDADSNIVRTNVVRYAPILTALRFGYDNMDSCANFSSTDDGCKSMCARNESNCTVELQENGQEGNLLEPATTLEAIPPAGLYVYGDEILTNGKLAFFRPGTNSQCPQLYEQPMKYNVNYTASCIWYFDREKGCNVSKVIKFLTVQITGTELCDKSGYHCVVPIFRDTPITLSNQKCDNYTTVNVHLATQQGAILGMLIKFTSSSNKCHGNYCILTTEILFRETSRKFLERMKMSKYENSEGRFRCPSEVTCPVELFYFMNLLDRGAVLTQFLVFVPLFLLLLFYVSIKSVESLSDVCFPL